MKISSEAEVKLQPRNFQVIAQALKSEKQYFQNAKDLSLRDNL